jgi:hypothetical protein
VAVTDGLFRVALDYRAGAFDGSDRYLEVAVQCAGDAAFTTLTLRQRLAPVPYARYALTGRVGSLLPAMPPVEPGGDSLIYLPVVTR